LWELIPSDVQTPLQTKLQAQRLRVEDRSNFVRASLDTGFRDDGTELVKLSYVFLRFWKVNGIIDEQIKRLSASR